MGLRKLRKELCSWGINAVVKMLWVKRSCRCGEQVMGYRKICSGLQGAVGLMSPGREGRLQWERAVLPSAEV